MKSSGNSPRRVFKTQWDPLNLTNRQLSLEKIEGEERIVVEVWGYKNGQQPSPSYSQGFTGSLD